VKTALITGAGRSLGRAYALRFARDGYRVAVADIDMDGARSVVAEIAAENGTALAVEADVSNESSVRGMVDATVEAFERVDVLINNAALFADLKRKPCWEIEVAEWDRLMGVNLRGPFLGMKAVVPLMREQGAGCIINISSNTVMLGRDGFLHYVSSKSAIVGMTRSAARELGPFNIRVNCIMPGRVITGEWANQEPERQAEVIRNQSLKRSEVPDDLVGVATFLASEDARFMTGQTLTVDGGYVFH
jgi:3-oxoacyl-[acyl-carrier protein] reductase